MAGGRPILSAVRGRDLSLDEAFEFRAAPAVEPVQFTDDRQRFSFQLVKKSLKVLLGYFAELVGELQFDYRT